VTDAAIVPDAGETSPVPGVPRNVFVLGLVSFAADVSTEMLYPVLPAFLTVTLGAPVPVVGVIEGVAEGTAGVSKVGAGWWSDRLPQRRPLVAGGYALAAVGKALLALSFVWPQVLVARFADRLGKGVRTAPRDALLADATVAGQRGRNFGFHRAADTLGAVVGPLIGLALVAAAGEDRLRLVFALAVLPAVLAVVLVSVAREHPRDARPAEADRRRFDLRGAPAAYWFLVGVMLLFTFGNSSDAFLLLRAQDLGLGLTSVILAYTLFNATYALLSFPAGIVADRAGPRPVLASGFALFGAVYLGMALAGGSGAVWPLFAAYGVTLALTEAVGRAFIADLVPPDRRGTFLGAYHTAIGLTAVVASALAGVLWSQVGPATPFALGAGTGLAAAALLLLAPRGRPAGTYA
jgi:MFS family permease